MVDRSMMPKTNQKVVFPLEATLSITSGMRVGCDWSVTLVKEEWVASQRAIADTEADAKGERRRIRTMLVGDLEAEVVGMRREEVAFVVVVRRRASTGSTIMVLGLMRCTVFSSLMMMIDSSSEVSVDLSDPPQHGDCH